MAGIRLFGTDGALKACAQGDAYANLLYEAAYAEGDWAEFISDTPHACVRVDDAVGEARVFLPEKRFVYRFPLSGDNLKAYAPTAFSGNRHLLSIRPDEGNERRNLACNPADQRGDVAAYPHATANVETRDESVFCARNVIDGLTIANGHGRWPYVSWGIGARTDARLTVDFGREVEIDEIVLYLRADFPHDAHWVQATVQMSNGFEITFPLEGRDGAQRVRFEKQKVRSLTLTDLIKSDHPSAFPALRQLMAFGQDV